MVSSANRKISSFYYRGTMWTRPWYNVDRTMVQCGLTFRLGKTALYIGRKGNFLKKSILFEPMIGLKEDILMLSTIGRNQDGSMF